MWKQINLRSSRCSSLELPDPRNECRARGGDVLLNNKRKLSGRPGISPYTRRISGVPQRVNYSRLLSLLLDLRAITRHSLKWTSEEFHNKAKLRRKLRRGRLRGRGGIKLHLEYTRAQAARRVAVLLRVHVRIRGRVVNFPVRWLDT